VQYWQEVNDKVARDKVSHALRTYMKKYVTGNLNLHGGACADGSSYCNFTMGMYEGFVSVMKSVMEAYGSQLLQIIQSSCGLVQEATSMTPKRQDNKKRKRP
jgi:hypothetical protein